MRLTSALCRLKRLGSRNRVIQANNYWQTTRLRAVQNLKVVQNLEERGRRIHSLQEVASTPHLPPTRFQPGDFETLVQDGTVAKEFVREEDHPLYHERVCHSVLDRTKLATGFELAQAKVTEKRLSFIYGHFILLWSVGVLS